MSFRTVSVFVCGGIGHTLAVLKLDLDAIPVRTYSSASFCFMFQVQDRHFIRLGL